MLMIMDELLGFTIKSRRNMALRSSRLNIIPQLIHIYCIFCNNKSNGTILDSADILPELLAQIRTSSKSCPRLCEVFRILFKIQVNSSDIVKAISPSSSLVHRSILHITLAVHIIGISALKTGIYNVIRPMQNPKRLFRFNYVY